MKMNIKPFHMIIVSTLMIIMSRYVFEYINPWAGWVSYGLSAYVLYKYVQKLWNHNEEKKDEENR